MTTSLMRLAGALLACAAIPAAPAFAQASAARSVDLPAAPLGQALARYTQATGVIVAADATLVRGKTSNPVRGVLTARAALDQMLRGSGLIAQADGHGGFVVARPAATPAPAAENTVLDGILVFGRLARDTTLSIPQTVDVLDNAALRASGADSLGEALRLIPGASRDGSQLDAFGDTYLMRGFPTNQTVNGIGVSTMRQARDSVGIERIEVLKGPASVLYGQLQPGSVINIVTKQPRRDFQGEASVSYGRFDDWRGTVDLTGPLTDNGNLRFRLTGAYDDADSFVDFWKRKHFVVSPVVALDLGEATTLTLEGLYTRNKLWGFFNGAPAEGTVLPNANGRLKWSLGLTDPTFNPSVREDSDLSARVEHRFSPDVTWRTAVSWSHEHRDEEGVYGLLGWANASKRLLTRAVQTSRSTGDTWQAHSDLSARFSTGPIVHDVVGGGDYTWFDRDTAGGVALAPSLDVFAPSYQLTSRPATTVVPSRTTTSIEKTRTAGLFVQDRVSLTDKLKVIGGVRWSDYSQRTTSSRGGAAATVNRQSQTAWTSQLGLLYTPVDRLALFANRTTSFLPVQGLSVGGAPLKPETGTQYELGAKLQGLDGRLALNGALFHLERGDVAVADRVNPGFLIAIGEQVAKGFEVSVDARPVDGLSLHAGYAYTDASTTKNSDPVLVGKRIRNIPKHSLVLRGDYAVRSGPLEGLTLGGSATRTGARAADINDSFTLPGYWRLDAQASYALTDRVTVGASLENLTNERYYSHAYSLLEVWPGAPRTWRVSVSSRF